MEELFSRASLVAMAASWGLLFRRLIVLRRQADRDTAFRLRAEETAQAFGNPDWDYGRSEWRDSAWTTAP